jgi:hypothetical protein
MDDSNQLGRMASITFSTPEKIGFLLCTEIIRTFGNKYF